MAKDINTTEGLKQYFDDFKKCTHKAIVEILSRLGVECVNKAREPHAGDWVDHTGNLRSSIGFMITYNGKEVTSDGFEPTAAPDGNGAKGQQEGQDFILSIASQNSQGYALVMVAGMNYAEYVEAHESRDVLAHVELFARREVEKRMNRVPDLVKKYMKGKGWENV